MRRVCFTLKTRDVEILIDLFNCGKIAKRLLAIAAQHLDIDDARCSVHAIQPFAGERTLAIQHQGLQAGEQGLGVAFRLRPFFLINSLGQLPLQPKDWRRTSGKARRWI